MISHAWIAAGWSVLAVVAPLSPALQGLRPDNKIVEQAESPILVTAYRAEYAKRTNESPESIRHDVEYRNRSNQKVVAIQFGLVSFDLWNEFLARTAGLSTEAVAPRGRERGGWSTPTDAAFAFHTAVVYVDRVRFESGEIWSADPDLVVAAMRTIQKDFDPANLNKK
jgi:hypothetical protein